MTLAADDRINALTGAAIQAAIEVHRTLGPGLLESAYLECLAFELRTAGRAIEVQKPLPLIYKEVKLHCGYRVDIVLERTVIVEVKCVDQIAPVHYAQILTYLKLTGCPAGLLLNFHVPVLKHGIRRVLNRTAQGTRTGGDEGNGANANHGDAETRSGKG